MNHDLSWPIHQVARYLASLLVSIPYARVQMASMHDRVYFKLKHHVAYLYANLSKRSINYLKTLSIIHEVLSIKYLKSYAVLPLQMFVLCSMKFIYLIRYWCGFMHAS